MLSENSIFLPLQAKHACREDHSEQLTQDKVTHIDHNEGSEHVGVPFPWIVDEEHDPHQDEAGNKKS
jgi:hypothetical protein